MFGGLQRPLHSFSHLALNIQYTLTALRSAHTSSRSLSLAEFITETLELGLEVLRFDWLDTLEAEVCDKV